MTEIIEDLILTGLAHRYVKLRMEREKPIRGTLEQIKQKLFKQVFKNELNPEDFKTTNPKKSDYSPRLKSGASRDSTHSL